MARKEFDAIGLEVKMFGFKKAMAALNPSRIERALDRGLEAGAQLVLFEIHNQSRIGRTGDYFDSWEAERISSTLHVVRSEGVFYAKYVPGRTQALRGVAGLRRDAGERFMRKIRRETTPRVREAMRESIREEYES